MSRLISAAIVGLCASVVGTATPAAAGVRELSAGEMDRISAGAVTLGVDAGAVAIGNFAITSVSGAGATSSTPTVAGGASEGGAVAGNAVGFTSGGSVATTAGTSGSVSGITIGNFSINATLAAGGFRGSTSVTFISGGTVFLP